MRLSRLYSNKPEAFEPIQFNEGLSAVLAEIRVPENQLLDTHNLGKTTVGQLIDFCLLKGKDRDFFVFKHETRFAEFAFYLELALPGGFLTIGRRVDPGSKIDFKRTAASIDNAYELGENDWDHHGVSSDRARTLLDGILAVEALRPWGFRNLVGYLIRSQQDYRDVFKLGKFSGKHKEWKPFVAHVLGMEAQPVIDLYDRADDVAVITSQLHTLTQEFGTEEIDVSMIDGMIDVKRRGLDELGRTLDSFDFREEDKRLTEETVEQTEYQIAALNEEQYRLAQLIQEIEESLEARTVIFKPGDAKRLFEEAGVLFAVPLEKDFDQLIEFNRAITEERSAALQDQLGDARKRRQDIADELKELNATRSASLEFLRESDSVAKYKDLSRRLARVQAELVTLEGRRASAVRLVQLRREKREAEDEHRRLQTVVEGRLGELSQDSDSRFGKIRTHFSEIVLEVLGEPAILGMTLNNQGGLEFRAEFISDTGTATSGDKGTSYKKLLCIAFDLAVLRAYLDVRFPRFVYLDGALEQLEPRKREKLIGVFREYAAYGIQPIISLLDSDLPRPIGTTPETLASEDVVLWLHDQGDSGRLFKMPPW